MKICCCFLDGCLALFEFLAPESFDELVGSEGLAGLADEEFENSIGLADLVDGGGDLFVISPDPEGAEQLNA